MTYKTSTRALLGGIAAVLLVCAVLLQAHIDPIRQRDYEPKIANVNSAVSQLPIEFALGAATGFREAIAGLLWVRTDDFFDDGDYEAVVPMVRIITWLDPHNTDVYQTGAWHMDYNFTDSDQRSDRRYIPLALALMKEGIANNSNDSSLYADLAFTHLMRKVEDFPQAVYWYQQGQALKATEPNDWDVTSVGHGLAHAYEATGQIDQAIAEWKLVIAEHQRRINLAPRDNIDMEGMRIATRNLNEDILRQKWRRTMTQPPFDDGFQATITRIAPMVLVFTGHMNIIGSQNFVLETGAHTWAPVDGTRVEIRLQDASYKYPQSTSFGLNASPNPHVTIMQDQVSVQQSKFSKKIDMSKDHGGTNPMYSFDAPKYLVTLWYNPASTNDNPPNAQDRTGWLGEGVTDPSYLDTSGQVPGTPGTAADRTPGLRMIEKTFVLTRDDIMGSGIKQFN